ncbi:TPA: hypothetical protein PCO36_004775 [Klebsiella oxytoca]|nr:hypothetical protein [Klebsiella oxytoca]
MAKPDIEQIIQDKIIEKISLSEIDLDINNPRFGDGDFNEETTQTEVLNFIVDNFGVDDVLSSLSVNGYFSAEPLICKKKGERYVVLEGNRRLTAMLILSNDGRAAAHVERIKKYQELHKAHGSPNFNPVPAITFNEGEDERILLSYLGVRHIVSTKDWDSFAKAHWVHSTVDGDKLSVNDVSTMTGDSHQTIKKLLQGYNYVKQLENKKLFIPENSNKSGRGSNTKYPFSWVYTILGYKQIKDFLKLSEEVTNPDPIPDDSLENAALILKAMFGDRSKGKDSQVGDSRNLSQLASAVTSPEKVRYLKEGKHVKDIENLTKPVDERLESIFFTIRELLTEANDRLVRESVNPDKIPQLIKYIDQLKRQFRSLDRSLLDQSKSGEGEEW